MAITLVLHGELRQFSPGGAKQLRVEGEGKTALEIVRVVDALPSDLSVRVGLHSGPCVIRTVGAGGRHDTVVLGGNVPLDVLAKNVDEYIRTAKA